MPNEVYFWVKALSDEAKTGFGEEWQICQLDPEGTVFLMGSEVMSTRDQWEFGTTVIGHDELIVSSQAYREAIESLRDQFSMAVLPKIMDSIEKFTTEQVRDIFLRGGFKEGTSMDAVICSIAYRMADAMIEARKKS